MNLLQGVKALSPEPFFKFSLDIHTHTHTEQTRIHSDSMPTPPPLCNEEELWKGRFYSGARGRNLQVAWREFKLPVRHSLHIFNSRLFTIHGALEMKNA